MQDILRERRVSNKIIDESMIEARALMSEALKLMSQSDGMSASIKHPIISERDCASTQLCKERAHHAMQSSKLREKHINDTQAHALTIDKINAKVSVINNECAVGLLE